MNSHLVWQTIQLCSMSWWIFSLPSSFVLLRKRCEQEKLLTASQHTFTITGKRDKSHKDREGAMRRRATLVVPVDRPDPEFWCSVQVSSCHDSVSFTSCLFLMHCCSCIWQYFFSLINLLSGFQFTVFCLQAGLRCWMQTRKVRKRLLLNIVSCFKESVEGL